MRALKKMVATGTVGGLGVALAMGSGAFACSPQAGVLVVDASGNTMTAAIHPGDTVQVKVNTNTPQEKAGHVKLRLVNGPDTGPLKEYVFDSPDMIAPKFVATVTLPADLTPNVPSRWGASVDDQPVFLPFGEGTTSNGFYAVPSLNRPSSPDTTIVAPPVSDPPPKAQPGPVMPGETIPAPKNATIPLGSSRRTITAPTAQPAPPAAQAAPTPEVKKPDNRTGVPVIGSVAAPLVASPAVAVQPVVAPADLWSGLTGNDQAPSLLDQVAPQRHSGGIPVGAILFGSGLVALAGVALATGRRRLAHSHIVRR